MRRPPLWRLTRMEFQRSAISSRRLHSSAPSKLVTLWMWRWSFMVSRSRTHSPPRQAGRLQSWSCLCGMTPGQSAVAPQRLPFGEIEPKQMECSIMAVYSLLGVRGLASSATAGTCQVPLALRSIPAVLVWPLKPKNFATDFRRGSVIVLWCRSSVEAQVGALHLLKTVRSRIAKLKILAWPCLCLLDKRTTSMGPAAFTGTMWWSPSRPYTPIDQLVTLPVQSWWKENLLMATTMHP
mmetsp:Transcript_51411/g.122201  ORF Transcript_51411/g.122201 Transcript_51411/m.122201 type:complete len:238 (-) Transcript_51411:536-1249(-)